MRPLSAQLFIAILALPLCASASDILCNSIPELQPYALSGFECGKGLSKLPITAPKGMSLIAACGYKKEEFIGIVGEFYFKGKATVNGEVRRVNDSVSGDSVWFDAKTPGKDSEFSSAILSLKFGDDPIAIQKFKLPPLSEESPCWAADAVVSVKLLYVLSGYGSNEEGNYPKEFEVLEVGQYRQCQEQQETVD